MGSHPSKTKAACGNASVGALARSGYFFRCTLCRRLPVSPRALPCLHTFCQDCLGSLAARDPLAATRGGLLCPQCGSLAPPRDPRQPPDAWPSLYPLNVFLEALMPAVTPTGRCMCRHREESQACRVCQSNFCARCGIPHSQPSKSARRKHSAIRLAKMAEEKARGGCAGDGCTECGGSGFTLQERLCSHRLCFDCTAERAVKSSASIHSSRYQLQTKNQTGGYNDLSELAKSSGTLEARIRTNRRDKDMESSKVALDTLASKYEVPRIASQNSHLGTLEGVTTLTAKEMDIKDTRARQVDGRELTKSRETVYKTSMFQRGKTERGASVENTVEEQTCVLSAGTRKDLRAKVADMLREGADHRAKTTPEKVDSGTEREVLREKFIDKHDVVYLRDKGVPDDLDLPCGKNDQELWTSTVDIENNLVYEAGAAMPEGGNDKNLEGEGDEEAAAGGCPECPAISKAKELFSEDPCVASSVSDYCEAVGPPEQASVEPILNKGGTSQECDKDLRGPQAISGDADALEFPWCAEQPLTASPTSPQDSMSPSKTSETPPKRIRRNSIFYERYRREWLLARKNSGKGTSVPEKRRSSMSEWSNSDSRSLASSRRWGSVTSKQQLSPRSSGVKSGTCRNRETNLSVRPTSSLHQRSRSWEPRGGEDPYDEGKPLRFQNRSSRTNAAIPTDSPLTVQTSKTTPLNREKVGESVTQELLCLAPEQDTAYESSTLPTHSSSGATMKVIMSCGSGWEGTVGMDKSDSYATESRGRGSMEDCVVSPSQDALESLVPKRTVSFSGKNPELEKDQPVRKRMEAMESNTFCPRRRGKRRRSTSEPAAEDMDAVYRDVEPALLTDVIVVPGNRVLATDWRNQCLKSWRWGDDSSSDVLPLEGGPHALAKMAEDTVAVSVPDARRLVLVHVSPRSRLARLQTWATRRRLYGLAFLGAGKMAASCPWDKLIEIRTIETGQVEMTVNVPSHFPALAWPEHLCVTSAGHVVVSEAKNGNLVCLNQRGEALWSLSDIRKPLGSCWDGESTLFVADGLGRSVWRVDETGHHAEEIITPYNLPGLGSPRSVAWHQGMLFICETADIRVLCPK